MPIAPGGSARPAASEPTARRRRVPAHVLWFEDVGADDTGRVGGKAASLGELYRVLRARGVRVPHGFVTTADAYAAHLEVEVPDSAWSEVAERLDALGVRMDRSGTLGRALGALFAEGASEERLDVHDRCEVARELFIATPLPDPVSEGIAEAYEALCWEHGGVIDVAVRSSATCEDSADASYAGQYESFLNLRGVDAVLDAWRRCAASAFTERAVTYQMRRGMDPRLGAVSVVVMKMVRSDLASSGVVFTLDPDSGNTNVVFVTASYGLGEPIVQGSVSPDTFLLWKEGLRRGREALIGRRKGSKEQKMVYAPDGKLTELTTVEPEDRLSWSLTEEEVTELALMSLLVEEHYGRPMDIEWAKDGESGVIYLVQARPETVHGGGTGDGARHAIEVHAMDPRLVERLKSGGRVLTTGSAVGSRIASGTVRRYATYGEVIERERRLRRLVADGADPDALPPEDRVFEQGDVLVTEMTTPDWEPLMRRASLIVTEKGGRTSHAAIVAREFGIPAIVGCGPEARAIEPLSVVTGTCAEGDTGFVFDGEHPFEVRRVDASDTAGLRTQVKLNIGFPERALLDAMLPSDGVGLARLEFILTSQVGVHPLALAFHDALWTFVRTGEVPQVLEGFERRILAARRDDVRRVLETVDERTGGWDDKRACFVERVRDGVATICAAFHPRPVLVRLSDLKSNEYRDLVGGWLFEPEEENPMIAWRGAARYTDERFRAAFDMECAALAQVRRDLGLENLQIMVPFCRTPEEGREVTALLADCGLSPEDGVPLFLMVELPTNVIEAERFIDEMRLSGGSIGTNDLVQTLYAVSRDDLVGYRNAVDARSPAARVMIAEAIARFRKRGLEIGICGQAPSDHPDEVPPFLVECGITSISVTPDTLLQVREAVKRAEAARTGTGTMPMSA